MEEELYRAVGRIEGKLDEMGDRQRALAANVEVVRQGFEAQGQAIGALQATDRVRRKQISDLYASVGKVREDTGRFVMAQVERTAVRRWWWKVGRAVWATKAFWLPPLVAAIGLAALAAVR